MPNSLWPVTTTVTATTVTTVPASSVSPLLHKETPRFITKCDHNL